MRVHQNLNLETLRPDKTVNPLSSLVTTLLGNLQPWNARESSIASIADGSCILRKGEVGTETGKQKNLEQKREEYKEAISLLKKGYSIRNVAKLTNKSVSTILSVKRSLALKID